MHFPPQSGFFFFQILFYHEYYGLTSNFNAHLNRQPVIGSGRKTPAIGQPQFPWRPQSPFPLKKAQTVSEHETIHKNCFLILLFLISMLEWILDYKCAGSGGRRFSWFGISLECMKWVSVDCRLLPMCCEAFTRAINIV